MARIKGPAEDVIRIGRQSTYEVVFSFKYLQENKTETKNKGAHLHAFLLRLKKLSELGWKEIRKSPKHSFGTEMIPLKQFRIKKNEIPIITDDVSKLTVFRASGDNKVFAGIEVENLFYIIVIEYDFGDYYLPHK